MVEIAKPGLTDKDWLFCEDNHVGKQWVLRCIDLGEYFVARKQGEIVGFLRFSRFWGRIPYLEMIRVREGHRRSGVGTALYRAWEGEMRESGARLLMTSSECDESRPQDWHRRNGFSETGSIELPGIQTVPEIFFLKKLD
ncbi:ribosomal protein S18 acetylase RimI-like enzyme [Rhizobium sp. BK619]|uniref:GNAT family N-acetyltransferase n=1 Tax=Rhizobium TaxID=379 RepID=UPI001608064D|nr:MULTISPECIES: GNAT family N-acetyltransferase [Rhizobium]MBB3644937.1 ribosomal protein S18 acetylase RimI-like enzyme [Rhizobium sp. BK619]MBB5664513.1 ribosomal protein S18 acetylase RimI-like enzyme [Rhizobium leguminosarum]